MDSANEDTLIANLIKTARGFVETFTRRALMEQTWDVIVENPKDTIEIPKPPLKTITWIRTIEDLDVGDIFDVDLITNSVSLKDGETWPDNKIKIRFVAGYSEVPEVFRTAILQIVANLYENRLGAKIPPDVRDALWSYRVLVL